MSDELNPPGASDEDRAAVQAQMASHIDDACARILSRFTRFAMEYELRESQAIAFKAAGYNGTVPRQVSAFSTRASITPLQATDIILAQATGYRAALDDLGDLRMRKFELTGLGIDAAQATYIQIMAAIDAFGRALQ